MSGPNRPDIESARQRYFDHLIEVTGFSIETIETLGGWLSAGQTITSISDEVIEELEEFRPQNDVDLFRAEVTISDIATGNVNFPFFTSWTYSLDMARNFASDRSHIIKARFRPEDILVDTTLLPYEFMRSYNPDEEEVIVLPGTYIVQVIE